MKILEQILARCAVLREQVLVYGVFLSVVLGVLGNREGARGHTVLAGLLYVACVLVPMACLFCYATNAYRGAAMSPQERAFEASARRELREHRRRRDVARHNRMQGGRQLELNP